MLNTQFCMIPIDWSAKLHQGYDLMLAQEVP